MRYGEKNGILAVDKLRSDRMEDKQSGRKFNRDGRKGQALKHLYWRGNIFTPTRAWLYLDFCSFCRCSLGSSCWPITFAQYETGKISHTQIHIGLHCECPVKCRSAKGVFQVLLF
ncbi:hypothetical protein GDO81_001313 [Engystomops pustulosus]|uniref:Uncharacterized protein n=1 Tax=Engystomops pustulosus TaxID=76066 RepID=A0AAV7DCT5_ENGPU|nr:hypothetical protein GDO81_001313 [Engystomops pustulosus]